MKIKILFVFVAVMLGFYGLNVYLGANDSLPAAKPAQSADTEDVAPDPKAVAPVAAFTATEPVATDEPVSAAPRSNRPAVVRVDSSPIDQKASTVVTSYADALEAVRPAVVSIYSTKTVKQGGAGFPFNDPLFRRFFGPGSDQQQERTQNGLGSGVIVSADGYILTNNHVVEGADEVRVALTEGRELEAEIVGRDPRTDVAVLKVEAEGLPHATLANSEVLRVGDVVFAVGNPLGVGQTVTMGIVSATGRSELRLLEGGYEDFIQTDASINLGNSGGALVDALGRVVGINTAIMSNSQGNIGIGFAIPINLAGDIMESLIETGTVSRGFLGVFLQDLDTDLASEFGLEDATGALVVQVSPDTPADEAGLESGDVLISVDGRPVASVAELRLLISQTSPGSDVRIGYFRDGDEGEANVTLGTLDEDPAVAATEPARSESVIPGVQLQPLGDEMRGQFQVDDEVTGLVVTAVDPASRLTQTLPVGTVVEQINRKSIASLEDAREAMIEGRNLLYVNYRGAYRYVTVEVEE